MPLLTKRTLGLKRPTFGSQPTASTFKKFKTPLLTKKAINEILKDDINLSQGDKAVSSQFSLESTHYEERISTSNNSQNSKKSSGLQKSAKSNLLRNVSIQSMHLSFESISQDLESNSDLSSHINEPKIKEAYLQFVASLDKSSGINSSITSSPLTQRSNKYDALLNKKLEELDDDLNFEELDVENKRKELASNKTESMTKKHGNKKAQLVTGGEDKIENSQLSHKTQRPSKKSITKVQKPSPDSSTSLSQEVLNRSDVKAAYLEFVNSLDDDDDDMIAAKNKGNVKRIYSEENLDEPLVKQKTKKVMRIISDDDAEIMPPPKKVKPVKSKNKLKEIVQEKAKYITNDSNTKTDLKEGKNKSKKEKLTKTNKSRKTTNKMYSSDENLSTKNLSLHEKMVMIQESRNVGLYAICDICDKARYLPHVKDPLDLPDQWYCAMNPDKSHSRCTDPEEVDEDEDFLIHNLYNAGSIVWAKMDGYPWWPAMVEDDPDNEDYFWLEGDSMTPTWYHVTFFDAGEVTRAWMKLFQLKPFKINMNKPDFHESRKTKYTSRVIYAIEQAQDAIELPLIDRLKKYSFIKRYNKPLKQNNTKRKNSLKKSGKERKLPQKTVSGHKKRNLKKGSGENGKVSKSNELSDNVSLIFNDVNWMESQAMFSLFDE